MKTLIIAMFSLLPFMTLHAQEDYKKNIEQEFNAYLAAIILGNYAESLDYLVDDLFEMISKEQMVTLMEQAMNNPEMELQLKDPKVKSIEDYKEIDGDKYALISYSLVMKLKYKGENNTSIEKQKEMMREMKPMIEMIYGEENVVYEEAKSTFEVFTEKNAYAIRKSNYDTWKYLRIEENQKKMLESLLPKELVDELFKED